MHTQNFNSLHHTKNEITGGCQNDEKKVQNGIKIYNLTEMSYWCRKRQTFHCTFLVQQNYMSENFKWLLIQNKNAFR